ncbi:MAG TPA: hypothetical protein VI893_08795 [Thermoplasmata archaeon]|nr:hypothetical protein [Thermoplasmata archaeon]
MDGSALETYGLQGIDKGLHSGPGDPGQIPFLSGFSTPALAPGESGTLNFSLRNRYADATVRDFVVGVEVYKYATRDSSSPVDGSSADAPAICVEARPRAQCTTADRVGGYPDLPPNTFPVHLRFDVHSSPETLHGSLFDPAAYFVRISLEFTHSKSVAGKLNETRYKLISRGFVTDADWEKANDGPGLDMEMISKNYSTPGLGYLDVIGIIPETSFTVREPFPLWPLAILIGLAALTGILGVMLWMHESRGSFPWLRAALDRGAGKMRKRMPPRPRKRR